ncbi:hypothetical protein DPSP01_010015 [Paraphaeosphaeria sporulosa]
MARLTDLSPELITQILEFSDWLAYLQLALSCRYLAHCSQRIMARHRKCHDLYRATSDISPKTLPTLCRALLKDPVAISHVLALEFWGPRVSWDDWKPFAILLPNHSRAEGSGGTEPPGDGDIAADEEFVLKPHELDALERIMHDKIRLCVEDCKSWRQKIEEGDDGALKGMLVALCPNLQAVRFVKYAEPNSEGGDADADLGVDEEDEELYRHHQSSLDFLVAAISAQHEFSWSPGLSSLSRIAVGVPSRAVASPESTYRIFSEQALPLFRLPNLDSLYLNGLTLTPEQLNDEVDDLDFDTLFPGSSPSLHSLVIEDAALAGSGDAVPNLIGTMIGASPVLRHVAFQDGRVTGFDLDRILPGEDSTIRSLLFYGAVEVQGYRSEMYYPEDIHTPVFTVDISDVMLCAPATEGKGGPGNGLDPKTDAVGRWGTSRSEFGAYLWEVFGDRIPEWEAIVFVAAERLSEEEAEMIDEGLVRFIRSVERGRLFVEGEEGDEEDEDGDDVEEVEEGVEDDADADNPPASQHPPRAIYLEDIDHTSLTTPRWYANAIRAGQLSGIQVHTRTTPAPRTHTSSFPWPASDKELQTSPLYGTPEVAHYLLKPHNGLVKDACPNCGECATCLEVMDAAAWARAREEEGGAEMAMGDGKGSELE